jgi:hypothetical protein
MYKIIIDLILALAHGPHVAHSSFERNESTK